MNQDFKINFKPLYRVAQFLALMLGLIGIACYYPSNPAFEMLSLRNRLAVKDHTIEEIEMLKHNNVQGQGAEIIPEKVINAKSLKVDSVLEWRVR
ncbi:MAG: hypothetical protein JJE49_03890 [Peptostreptococcaceae bacterium]|nr:hypothetical protein [Peptostreptococcaceae bacterium]